ncbi:MAG: DUF968 domain-containing protein [Shinella sp.]|nr:DUF968 domain-containing protein [Shinella sp.]
MAFRVNNSAAVRDPAPPQRRPKKRRDYLAFLHHLPCVVTGRHGVQAAHLSYSNIFHGHFGRGKGTKAPDRFALPLCPEEHALQHSMNERAYWESKGIDPHALANTLFGIWNDYDEPEAITYCTQRINQGLAIAGRLPTRDV